jgi:hypothetical protein
MRSSEPNVAAGPPRLKAAWKFDVKFGDGVQTYNENLTRVVNIWVPPEMHWSASGFANDG